jgi:transcriptional regulator with XRE-family HTH domain
MKIGSTLRCLRNTHRFSQNHVARELNMTQSNYSKLEADKFFPSGEVLEGIARLYKIPMEKVLLSATRDDSNNDSSTSFESEDLLHEVPLLNSQLENYKDMIINLQKRQIELLEFKIKTLRVTSNNNERAEVEN